MRMAQNNASTSTSPLTILSIITILKEEEDVRSARQLTRCGVITRESRSRESTYVLCARQEQRLRLRFASYTPKYFGGHIVTFFKMCRLCF